MENQEKVFSNNLGCEDIRMQYKLTKLPIVKKYWNWDILVLVKSRYISIHINTSSS